MLKKFLLIAFFILQYSLIFSQTTIHFNDDWKFKLGNAANPLLDFNYGNESLFHKSTIENKTPIDANFNDSNWQAIQLPHDWAVQLPFVNYNNFAVAQHGYKPIGALFPETSIGWYRKHFVLPKTDSGKQINIQFDGIFRNANIWINGFFLGNHQSGYIGEIYNITNFISFQKENVITVRVDATQYEGWFYEGAGIYRNVWLKKFNDIHINNDGVFAYASVNKNNATITTETEIVNENIDANNNITIQSFLLNRVGNKVAQSSEEKIKVHFNNTITSKQNFVINNPHLWSLTDPYLYKVKVVLKQNGKIIDQNTTRFGIRTVTINKDGVFINGKYTKILGTNNHQDHAGVGAALPDYLQYYRVRLLKEMGSNAIRTSHNPPTPELLDACDSLGMLVLDETRISNSTPEYYNQFKKLLKRDRNHPSVFLWSIGNEERGIQSNRYGYKIAKSLLALQQQLDPTRTSTYAADNGKDFEGINQIIPIRGFNYREYAVADYHTKHPLQPILGTEMGSTVTTRGIYERDTINNYVIDKDIEAPWWASTAETWWKLAEPNKFWLGGFIWTGFDYRGEPTPFDKWPNISSHFGVMDVCGFPKNIYYYYKSWWSDKDVLHILPHWNWKGSEGKPIDVWVFSNADSVELFLNEKSLGIKTMPRNGHLQWSVNYQPGVVKAIAYKNNKNFSAKVETTNEAATIIVQPSKTTMYADGKDAVVINVTAVDKSGREVPTANNLIKFSIKGDAKIIGVGNGDPSCHEADKCEDGKWQRSLFNGKCQVIIQAGKTSSTIMLDASSEGLWNGATEIFSIPTIENYSINKSVTTTHSTPKKEIGKMIGADISFLQELEDKGIQFSYNNQKKDAIDLLKEHGFNYIRLRIFNNPSADSGYAPNKGYCDLAHTLAFAKRIKNAGLKFLLDFHYSDTWADPGKQFIPNAWKNIALNVLQDSVYNYTKQVILALQQQGTPADMVQIGNEINHGMLWPYGHVKNFDALAQLFKSGANAVKSVAPATIIMLHIALGGQNDESVFFIENMLARGVEFDVIGQSYYPQWHGSLNDLENNLHNLIQRYNKDVIVVEYSAKKQEINEIVFNLPNQKGKGTFIWEPLNTWEQIFDDKGNANHYLNLYDEFKIKYLLKK